MIPDILSSPLAIWTILFAKRQSLTCIEFRKLVAASILLIIQNYYTAITRAQFGVKLWTEDQDRLAQKLAQRSGEKTSSLEGLGRLDRDKHLAISERHEEDLRQRREEQQQDREALRNAALERQLDRRDRSNGGLADRLAGGARSIAELLDGFLQSVLDRGVAADPHAGQHPGGHRTPPLPPSVA